LRVAGQELRVARLTEQLTTIRRMGQRTTAFHTGEDGQQLFAQITRVIRESLGFDHTQLLLIEPAGATARLAHASGLVGELLLRQGYAEQVGGDGIIGWVAGSGQPWICNDVAQDPHYKVHTLLPNTASEAALPLKIGERVIGVLDVQADRPGAFDEDDVLLLQILADQIAPALEHARLFAAERDERELATTLRDVSRIICASLELEQVLELILSQIDRVVPHIGTRITLLGDDGLCRVVAAEGYADNEEAKRAAFRIEEAPLAVTMIHEHQTTLVQDARTDPRWIWLPGALEIRSWCGAPLVIRDRCIGWLCVDWHEPGFYRERHARIVRAFADQAAVAIENARLYAQVKGFNEQLEEAVRQRTGELRVANDEIASKAQQLRALIHRVTTIQEAERQRIASDLHDGITQAILGAIYELQALRKRNRRSDDTIDRRLDECQQLLEGTLIEMKHIIYELRPRALDELGLLAALQNLAASIRAHHGVAVECRVVGASAAYPLSGDVELAVYRIVQEATQNCIRHSGGKQLTISVEFRPALLRVHIADDGQGFAAGAVVAGLGLVGMRERAQAVGGTLWVQSAPGQGTKVTLEIPPGGETQPS
jgi:signal transduction histidine kinase